ncbi:ashwin [Phyllopteryx taeniolatus]|uniref:ashwin n=1 Tax=Phyllopteryx taeniolatus TaxID=161469 RepID=UPI002AD2906B|nr:ashwin [Phyllopteryx taeniolatus]
MLGNTNMATRGELAGKAICASELDVLLHPELLSQDFLQLILNEKKVNSRDCGTRDQLVDLYVRHVIPRPQRTLPNNRWGKRMAKTRGGQAPTGLLPDRDHLTSSRLISCGSLKAKKPETSAMSSSGEADRLKPPPALNLANPIRRLCGSSSSSSSPPPSSSSSSSSSSSNQKFSRCSDAASLKREANCSGILMSPEVKKKIQHVTWP